MEVRLAERLIAEWASANAAAIGIGPNKIRAVIMAVMESTVKLHRDDRLRGILPKVKTRTYAEAFEDEIARLKDAVWKTSAFLLPAGDVVHNDLNGNNVLTCGRDRFRIIDWDDLSGQGDAAIDYSVLIWPLTNEPSWPMWREKVLACAGADVAERLELHFRA